MTGEIKYYQLFPYEPYLNFSIECSVTPKIGEQDDDAFIRCFDQVQRWSKIALERIKKGDSVHEMVTEIPTIRQEPAQQEIGIPQAIATCKSIKELESFKLIVKNNPQFQNDYDNRHKELSNK
jgi:hypothetical protein